MSITVPQFVRADVTINAATGVETFPTAGTVPVADGAGGAAWAPLASRRFLYELLCETATSLYSDAAIAFAWDPAVGQVTFVRPTPTENSVVGRYTAAAGAVLYKSVVTGAGPGAIYLSSATTVPDEDFNPSPSVNAQVWNQFTLARDNTLTDPMYTITVMSDVRNFDGQSRALVIIEIDNPV